MASSITIRHNFESAHRLPILPGKCVSLHGHSFHCEVMIAGPLDDTGILVEYADAKRYLRTWVDTQWDHGCILGLDDDLAVLLRAHDTKVFVIDGWPTVETLARHLGEVMDAWCRNQSGRTAVRVTRCTVHETDVNSATWLPYESGF